MLKRILSSRRFFLTPKLYVFAKIKEKLPAQKEHIVGPQTARERYAISMAYRMWAFDGPTLFGSWVGTLWQYGDKKETLFRQ